MKFYKRIISGITATIMLGAFMVGCTQKTPTDKPSESKGTVDKAPKELSLYLAGFQNQDPHIWTWGTHVDRMGIFEGLTTLNPDLSVKLANAEKIEHNEDYTVWTATLRKDLKWSDGVAITANDYYWSMERVIEPTKLAGKTSAYNTQPPIVNALECQKGEKPFSDVGIKVVDEYTLEFTLFKTKTDFDATLAESWALPVPKHVIEAKGDEWTSMGTIVTNGPYIPTDRKEDVQLTLKPNANYYGETSFDKITIYAGTQNQLVAYKNGDINIADIKAADIDAVVKDPELKDQLQIFESGVVSYLGLLHSSNNILQSNQKVRQAISLSLDRELISTQINKNTTSPAYSLVSPKFASWGNDVGLGGYNVEKAKTLMAEAGFPEGKGFPEITLLVAGNPNADVLAMADMITKGTGIKVKIENKEWASYVKDRDLYHDNDGVLGFFYDGWGTSVPGPAGYFANFQFDIRQATMDAAGMKKFAESNGDVAIKEKARTTSSDPLAQEYNTKLQAALKLSDPVAIDAAYKELETIRQQSSAFIPVVWNNGCKLIKPELKGYIGNPLLLGTPPMYFNDISF